MKKSSDDEPTIGTAQDTEDTNRIAKQLKEATEKGTELPEEVSEARRNARAIADVIEEPAEQVCCKIYIGFGQFEYRRLQRNACTSFPLNGEVVDDSSCN